MRHVLLIALLTTACSSSGHAVAGPDAAATAVRGPCPAAPVDAGAEASAPPPSAGGRDWTTSPAIADLAAPPTIYAVSDIHGGYDRLTALLLANHVIASLPSVPCDAHWAAGSATLVVVGDLIDKGPASVEVLDFLMALQADAPRSGGRVVVTLGNHEAELLVDPGNSKASGDDGIDRELAIDHVLPASLASGADPRGAWIRLLPFGAKIGRWFFAHAGDTHGRTVAALESVLEGAVLAHGNFDDPEIVGDSSILESRAWYADPGAAPLAAAALGVDHIVFGHQPSALGPKGQIAVGSGGLLFRIDCGLSPDVDDSTGMLLRITQQGAGDLVEQLDAGGRVTTLLAAGH